MPDRDEPIDPRMTVLDVVARWRKTEAVFKQYDTLAGECICCQALFEPIQDMARKYHLDLALLMTDLKAAVDEGSGN